LSDHPEPASADSPSSDGSADDPLLASVAGDQLPDFTESMHLLVRAQDGDDLALDELFRRYEARLSRIVRIGMSARLRRCVETVDVVQETYRAALRRINDLELRSTASILQWLAKIAENQMLDTHRRFYGLKRDKQREVRLGDGARGDGETNTSGGVVPADKQPTPAEQVASDELRRIVDDAVAELPDDYREVIMLRTYYGGAWDWVAEQMGRPGGDAARQLHRRARMKLSRILMDRMPDGGGLG
jgi:RNA polymerase sigma-70 factor (ECF subfamily)